MANSNITLYENSLQDGQPMECYRFRHKDTTYLYTSNRFDVQLTIKDSGLIRTEKYAADYIKRQNIQSQGQGDPVSLTVTVSKDNAVAKLFQGTPPDKPVTLDVYRLHDQDHTAFDKVFIGEVIQGNFKDSECELTVKVENWLTKKLPNMMRQFFCNNTIYDTKCRLNKADWGVSIYIDKVEGLTITASQLAAYAENYFAGGLLYYGDNVRMIDSNNEDKLVIRYPFPTTPMNDVTIYPGCDQLFRTCALRYQNTLNFSGCPYVAPATDTDTKVGKGVYWADDTVVQRDTDGFVGTISM